MTDYSSTPVNEIPFDLKPTDKVSAHFTLWELIRSETASRRGIDNSFPDVVILRASVHLCRQVLEPIRVAHRPFPPNSVFRCQALERALKDKPASWTSDSKHTTGCVCDLEVPGLTTLALAQWAKANPCKTMAGMENGPGRGLRQHCRFRLRHDYPEIRCHESVLCQCPLSDRQGRGR